MVSEIDEDHIEDEDEIEGQEGESEDSDSDSAKKEKKEDGKDEIEVVEDDEDERIAPQAKKLNEELTREQIRDRRKRQRQARKQRDAIFKQNARGLIAENEQLKQKLNEIEERSVRLEKRQATQDETQIDNAIQSQANLYRTAEAQLAKAVTEGDGIKAAEAQRVMLDANNKYTQLIGVKNQYSSNGRETEIKKPQASEADKAHLVRQAALTQRWMDKNDWFDPEGQDKDSRLAKRIDRELAAEGHLKPNSPEYYEELDDRIAEELPHLSEKPAKPKMNGRPRPKQVNGSIGADSAPTGKGKIQIPKSVMEKAKALGYMENPKMLEIFKRNWLEVNGKGN